jgi:hypothetical protein
MLSPMAGHHYYAELDGAADFTVTHDVGSVHTHLIVRHISGAASSEIALDGESLAALKVGPSGGADPIERELYISHSLVAVKGAGNKVAVISHVV